MAPAAPQTFPSEDAQIARRRAQRKKLLVTVVMVSIGLHVLAGIGAGIWIVAKYLTPPPATFVAKKSVQLPPKIVEQKMQSAEFEAATPKPTFDDKMASLRPTDFALPDLPQMPVEDMVPLDPSTLISDNITDLVGAEGAGAGDGAGQGGFGGVASDVSFMGIKTSARRIVIMYDISTTVVNSARRAKIPFEKIREETLEMLQNLSINSAFGLVQFARNYAFFRPELLPATDPNRAQAKEWLERWFAVDGAMPRGTPNLVTGGPGFLKVLEAVFQTNPDVIFVISDGNFFRSDGGESGSRIPYDEIERTIRDLQRGREEPVTIHFVTIGASRDTTREVRKWVRQSGGRGQVREID
ncbi:MAG: hypothetical protein SNJ84_02545 [Verrucomicrobiia bacterium]